MYTATKKEKPEQLTLDAMPDPTKDDAHMIRATKAATLALAKFPEKSEAIAFLERDIERHRAKYESDVKSWKSFCVGLPKNTTPPPMPRIHSGAAECQTAIHYLTSGRVK